MTRSLPVSQSRGGESGSTPTGAVRSLYFLLFQSSLRNEVEPVSHGADEAELIEQLRDIQQRLGTPEERPEDLKNACLVAHEVSNFLTERLLARDLDAPSELSRPGRRGLANPSAA